MDEETTSDVDHGGITAREILGAVRRRRTEILAVAIVIAAIGLIVAIALPATYRSAATILVQEQEVPPDLVRSTITSFADERIQVISQQIMTRAVLLRLVEKHGLYGKYRDRISDEEIVDRMHKDIKLSTINADVSDRSSGRRVNATIAFKISYDASDPVKAQTIVNELVALYLDENVRARRQSVAETNAFLAQEADRVATQIKGIETKLAEFKRRNVGRMPESSAITVQLADRTESELRRVEREMSILQDRKLSLESQLVLIKPKMPGPTGEAADRPSNSEERLQALQAQYAKASAIYGADHPDVRRLQREIAALRPQPGARDRGDAADQIGKLESELASLKERYGDDHPDVQRIRRSISSLKAAGAAPTTASKASDDARAFATAQPPDNPAYIVLSAQLENTKRELTQLAALKDDLRAKQRTYDARLVQIPEVEREYSELTRDYTNAQTRYREIRTKQMQAEGAMELEKDSKAERFSLSEPANLPQRPFSPNRPAIAVAGVFASVAGGLSLAWLREVFDPSVKGPLQLARLTPVPLLTPIPYIETRAERRLLRRRTWAIGALAALLAVCALLAIHVFLRPLPSVVEAALRRLPIW
jgi:uncharacterized protein involved in exopolysaccharide biosynthesis